MAHALLLLLPRQETGDDIATTLNLVDPFIDPCALYTYLPDPLSYVIAFNRLA